MRSRSNNSVNNRYDKRNYEDEEEDDNGK